MKGKSLKFVAGDGSRRQLTLASEQLASGADGQIFLLDGLAMPAVAKLYHPDRLTSERQQKLQAMLENAPELPDVQLGGRHYVQLAWPLGMLYEAAGSADQFLGFAMPAVDLDRSVTLEILLSEKSRKAYGLPSHYGYQLAAACNVAALLAELHAHGHHVIDLKPVNIHVYTDKLFIAMLDCDGFSIAANSDAQAEHFPAHQYTPDYIAPEAWKTKQAPEALGEQQDLFALAVILFRLLNRGLHPYQGVPKPSVRHISTNQDRIAAGLYAYGLKPHRKIAPSPWSLHEQLPLELRRLFDRAFGSDSGSRPTPSQWLRALQPFADPQGEQLVACRKNKDHAVFAGLECGHCLVEQRRKRVTQGSRPRQVKRPPPNNQHRQPSAAPAAAAQPPSITAGQWASTALAAARTRLVSLQQLWGQSGWTKWAWPLFLVLAIGLWQLQANRDALANWLVEQRYQASGEGAESVATPVEGLLQEWRLAINNQNFTRMLALLRQKPANELSPDGSACCEAVDIEMQYPRSGVLEIQPPEKRLPLGYAAAQPDGLSAVVALLGLGFEPLQTDADGYHAVDIAAYYGRSETLEVLLGALDAGDYQIKRRVFNARKMAFYGPDNSRKKALQLIRIFENAGFERRRISPSDTDKYEDLLHYIDWYNRHRRFQVEPETRVWRGRAE